VNRAPICVVSEPEMLRIAPEPRIRVGAPIRGLFRDRSGHRPRRCALLLLLAAAAPSPAAQAKEHATARPAPVTPARMTTGGDVGDLEAQAQSLMARWAPVFLQQVSRTHPERDRPLRIDFDGDWDATNNWAGLTPRHRHDEPVVYGSNILTETHAYLTYTLFYPRDWIPALCVPRICHDNDLEVALVVVHRGPTAEDPGMLAFVETKAHHRYHALPAARLAREHGRPMFSVESQGHGILPLAVGDALPAPSVRYEPRDPLGGPQSAGAAHPEPHETGSADRRGEGEPKERYRLLSLRDTLWHRRAPDAAAGTLWIEGETGWLGFDGERLGRLGQTLGASMAGREYAGGVRPPWGLRGRAGQRGDWFLDPAYVASRVHREWLPEATTSGGEYVFNPYVSDLSAECVGSACPAAPAEPAGGPWRTLGGVLLALGIVSLRAPRRGFARLARGLLRRAAR
jgi:hypothetical protein